MAPNLPVREWRNVEIIAIAVFAFAFGIATNDTIPLYLGGALLLTGGFREATKALRNKTHA